MTDAASPSEPELTEAALDLQAQLIDACLDDDVQKVRELVKQHGAIVDEPDAEGRVALLDAAAEGHSVTIHALAELGADLDIANEVDQLRAIHYAASYNHASAVRALVERGCDVNATNGYGETALHFIAQEGHEAVLAVLLDAARERVDLDARAEDDWTAMHWAAHQGHDSMLSTLTEAGAKVDSVDSHGRTPMCTAVLAAECTCLRTLHDAGGSLTTVANNDMTLLDNALLAARHDPGRYNEVIKQLIAMGSEVGWPLATQAVGRMTHEPRLNESAFVLMLAYLSDGNPCGQYHLAYIHSTFSSPEQQRQLFDAAVLNADSPLWVCLTVASVLEAASSASLSQHHLIQPLISSYVEHAAAIAGQLHHPEEEDKSFKDSAKQSLKQILEPNTKKLRGHALIAPETPLEIASRFHYTSIFDQPAVQKYMSRKWRGGRELKRKLDDLADEICGRCAIQPRQWPFTAKVVRLMLMLFLTVTCADDGSFISRFTQRKMPHIFRRMFANQWPRCRQSFAVPRTRFLFELFPQLCLMFLYSYGELSSHASSYEVWDPESKLFGQRLKGSFRLGEWLFTFYVVGLLLSEVNQVLLEGSKNYFTDFFNLFDIGVLANFAVVVVLRVIANNVGGEVLVTIQGNHGDYVDPTMLQIIQILMSVGGIFLWVRLLEAFAIHPTLGPLIEMIKTMFKDLITFLTLLFIIMMGFATAFHNLFHNIDAYKTWTKTLITLLSNLIGEELQFVEFEKSEMDPTLAALGKLLQAVYLLIGTVLLLNLLIAILTDNFRRISENIQSEYTFGKAELVQRITRRVSLAHPPLNVLQPLFFFFGDKQQELPIGYPVEALFTPPRNAVRDAAAAAAEKETVRGTSKGSPAGTKASPVSRSPTPHEGSSYSPAHHERAAEHGADGSLRASVPVRGWYDAEVVSAQGSHGDVSRLATSSWNYLTYRVRFVGDGGVQGDELERLNAGRAVPIRGRRNRAFPLLITLGREEVRYLLDLIGTWPFAYAAVFAIWFCIWPYMWGIIMYKTFDTFRGEIGAPLTWALSPLIAIVVVLALLFFTLTLMLLLIALWMVQIVTSFRNVLAGGFRPLRVGMIVKKKKLRKKRRPWHGTALRRGAKRRKRNEGDDGDDLMEDGHGGCTYIDKTQLQQILRTSVHANNVAELDKKTERNLRAILDRARSVQHGVGELTRNMEEMEERVFDGMERQGRELRQILELLDTDEADGINEGPRSGNVRLRRGALHHAAIAQDLQSEKLQKILDKYEKERSRKVSSKMSVTFKTRKSSRVAV